MREIARDAELAYQYTGKGNLVAVISDGTAILGLGNLGRWPPKPVMEGKGCAVQSASPASTCSTSRSTPEPAGFHRYRQAYFHHLRRYQPRGHQAPECFEIERALIEQCDIPVFHDDQHGTAIVTAAGMLNALELTGKKLEEAKIVCLSAGAAAISCMKLLVSMGAKVENIYMIDRRA